MSTKLTPRQLAYFKAYAVACCICVLSVTASVLVASHYGIIIPNKFEPDPHYYGVVFLLINAAIVGLSFVLSFCYFARRS